MGMAMTEGSAATLQTVDATGLGFRRG